LRGENSSLSQTIPDVKYTALRDSPKLAAPTVQKSFSVMRNQMVAVPSAEGLASEVHRLTADDKPAYEFGFLAQQEDKPGRVSQAGKAVTQLPHRGVEGTWNSINGLLGKSDSPAPSSESWQQSYQDMMLSLMTLNQLTESERSPQLENEVKQRLQDIRDGDQQEQDAKASNVLSYIETLNGEIDQHTSICENLNFKLFSLFLKCLNIKYSNQTQELGPRAVNDMYKLARSEYDAALLRYFDHNTRAFTLWMTRVHAKYQFAMMTLVESPPENQS
jgi:hypothetical protein